MDCNAYPVAPPKIVAVARDKNIVPMFNLADSEIPGAPMRFGQDLAFGVGRRAPGGQNVGKLVADLIPRMLFLLKAFADDDDTGMAKRLFSAFLEKQTQVVYFQDADLNKAADGHDNIDYFCRAALGGPYPWGVPPASGTTRIHQALKAAGWDISKLVAPSDLGVPAFNKGSKLLSTGDFGNGLGLMINGVQHAYVIATHYHYDPTRNFDCIRLKYLFFDVFGLDDEDLRRFGADDGEGDLSFSRQAQGITAWWQLQHQHGFAPLVTRIALLRTYEMPAI